MAKDLATAIREARVARNLSQVELARRVGVHSTYLSRLEGATWERGGPWPSDGVLRALARVLDLSSSTLIELRASAQRIAQSNGRTVRQRSADRKTYYAVSIGDQRVQLAARGVVERVPSGGTIRAIDVRLATRNSSTAGDGADYVDAIADRLARDTGCILWRACTSSRDKLRQVRSRTERLTSDRAPGSVGNIRTRFVFANPVALEILITDDEALIGIPDRRGYPYLRACLTVDDPDFVTALRHWFDELVWDPAGAMHDIRYDDLDRSFSSIEEQLAVADQARESPGPATRPEGALPTAFVRQPTSPVVASGATAATTP